MLRSALLLLGFILFQGDCVSKEKAPVQPTIAKESVAVVERGGDTQVTLEAVPSFGNELSFEIVSPPTHGTLSSLKSTSDHTASVTYHHDGNKISLSDEFLFRVQAPGQAKSTACRVSIQVVRRPPLLEFAPPSLDFGEVTISGKRQTNVLITNIGGTRTRDRLLLPKGFSAPDGDGFALGEGESISILLEFKPMEERNYSAQATCQHSPEKDPLLLNGVGSPRFELTKIIPTEWEVNNLSDQTLLISFTGGEGWILPKEFRLLSHEKMQFTFTQSDEEGVTNSVATASVVHMTDGLSYRDIELPPLTRFVPTIAQPVSSTSLGSFSLGEVIPVTFSILNRSGFPKHIRWKAFSQSGGGMSSPSSIELHGGECKEVHFDWRPTLPGEAKLGILMEEGSSTSHNLEWQATIRPFFGLVSPPPAQADRTSIGRQLADDASKEELASCPQITETVPPIDGLAWSTTTYWFRNPCVSLKWDASPEKTSLVNVEEKRIASTGLLVLKKGSAPPTQTSPLNIETVSLDTGSIKKHGRHEELLLSGLTPGSHLLVVTRISKTGALEAQSQLQVSVPTKQSVWKICRTPLCLLAMIFLIIFLRSRRSSD